MGMFAGMNSASSTQGGNYIRPGNYLYKINRVKVQESQVGSKSFFVAELEVLAADKTDDDVKPNGVGENVSMIVEVPGKYPELSFGNIKAFLKAAYGTIAEASGEDGPTDEDIDEEMTEAATSEDNPLAGVFVYAKAFNKLTKQGKDFTRVDWSVPSNLKELL